MSKRSSPTPKQSLQNEPEVEAQATSLASAAPVSMAIDELNNILENTERKENNMEHTSTVPEKEESRKSILKIIGNDYSFVKFSGKEDVEEFLNQFRLKELELSNAQLIALAEVNTTDSANKWVQVMRIEGIVEWKILKEKFISRFGKKKLSRDFEYSKLLINGPGSMDIRDYVYELRILAAEIKPSFNDVKLRFCEIVPLGLKDMLMRITTWGELLEIIEDNFAVINNKNKKPLGIKQQVLKNEKVNINEANSSK